MDSRRIENPRAFRSGSVKMRGNNVTLDTIAQLVSSRCWESEKL